MPREVQSSQAERQFVAKCDGCGASAIVRPDQTISAPCDCALRDPGTRWETAEVIPRHEAEALAEALEAVNLVNPPTALAEYRSRHPKATRA